MFLLNFGLRAFPQQLVCLILAKRPLSSVEVVLSVLVFLDNWLKLCINILLTLYFCCAIYGCQVEEHIKVCIND